jgi:Novel toxin 21
VSVSDDIDGHKAGAIWKRAIGKAENLSKKETRVGTFNADLTIKIGK